MLACLYRIICSHAMVPPAQHAPTQNQARHATGPAERILYIIKSHEVGRHCSDLIRTRLVDRVATGSTHVSNPCTAHYDAHCKPAWQPRSQSPPDPTPVSCRASCSPPPFHGCHHAAGAPPAVSASAQRVKPKPACTPYAVACLLALLWYADLLPSAVGRELPPLPPLPGGPIAFKLPGASMGASADYSDSSEDDAEIASMGSDDEISSMDSGDERPPVAVAPPAVDLSKFSFLPSEAWGCPSCQHPNPAVTVDQCAKCGALRPEALDIAPEVSPDGRPSLAPSVEGQYIVNDQLYSSVLPSRRVSMLTNASELPSEASSQLPSQHGSAANLLPPPLPPRSKSQLSMDPLLEVADEASRRPSVDIAQYPSEDVAQDRVQVADGDVQPSLATRPRLRNPFSDALSPGADVRKPSALRNTTTSASSAPSTPENGRRKATRTIRKEVQGDAASSIVDEGVQGGAVKETAAAPNPLSRTDSAARAATATLHATNPFAMFETDV